MTPKKKAKLSFRDIRIPQAPSHQLFPKTPYVLHIMHCYSHSQAYALRAQPDLGFELFSQLTDNIMSCLPPSLKAHFSPHYLITLKTTLQLYL